MAFASRAAFRAIPSSWRCYSSGSHNKTTPHYLSFKKGVSNVRVKFIEELKLEKKMMMEDSNSQTAQEARKESEREALALEENEKELQRMAEKREKRMAWMLLSQEERRLHKTKTREKVMDELKEKRVQNVKEMIERSKNFVTMDNLEEKIEEALAKETNYNFALSITGKKV